MTRPVIHADLPVATYMITRADLLNGWTIREGVQYAGTLYRFGPLVTWALPSLALTGADATASVILTLPLGYRVGTTGNYGAVGWVDAGHSPVRLSKDFSRLSCAERGTISGVVTWVTSDPMP